MAEVKLVSKLIEAIDNFIAKNPEIKTIKKESLLKGLKNRGVKVDDPIYKPMQKFIGDSQRVDIKGLKNYLENNLDIERINSLDKDYMKYANVPKESANLDFNYNEDVIADSRFPTYNPHWSFLRINNVENFGPHSRYIYNLQTPQGKIYSLQEIQYDAAQSIKNAVPIEDLPKRFVGKSILNYTGKENKKFLEIADDFLTKSDDANQFLKNTIGKTYNELTDSDKTKVLNFLSVSFTKDNIYTPTRQKFVDLSFDNPLDTKFTVGNQRELFGKFKNYFIENFVDKSVKDKDAFVDALGRYTSTRIEYTDKFMKNTKGKVPLIDDWWKYELNYNLSNAAKTGHNIFEVILDSKDVQPRAYPSINTGKVEKVDKWYQDAVYKYLKGIAKQMGTDVKIETNTLLNGDPLVARLYFPKDVDIKLYKPLVAMVTGTGLTAALADNAEAADAIPLQEAVNKVPELLEQGYTKEEIDKFFKEAYGIDLNEAKTKFKKLDFNVNELKFQTPEQLEQNFIDNKFDTVTTSNYEDILAQQLYKAKETYSKLKRKKFSILEESFFAPLIYDKIELAKTKFKANTEIGKILQEQGYEVFVDSESGDLYINLTGQSVEDLKKTMGDGWTQAMQPLDESILDSIINSLGETSGAITGAAIGARVGAPFGFGMLFGAAAGAGVGYLVDYLKASMDTKTKIDYIEALDNAKDSGALDVAFTVLGSAAYKLTAKTIKTTSDLVKTIKYNTGNEANKALKALKDILNLTDDQLEEAALTIAQQTKNDPVAKFVQNGKLDPDKAIESVITTMPGGEAIVRPAARKNLFTIELASNIDKRAKDLKLLVNNSLPEQIGDVVIKDLTNYRTLVKELYSSVKQQGIKSVPPELYQFDMKKLALPQVLDSIEKNIKDPTKLEQFLNYIKVINNRTTDRSFEALLDLRQAVNDFKYSKILEDKRDFDAINSVLKNIDGEISTVVKNILPENEARAWLNNWKIAKQKYAEMKMLENNVLFKALNKPGISEQTVRRLVSKYASSLDNTFNDVMVRLPANTRTIVEKSIIDYYLEKNMKKIEGFSAIDFEKLAENINAVKIGTPEGKELKAVINEMAKIYKNDVALSRASRGLFNMQNSTYITDDLVARSKFELVNRVFDYIKRKMPTKKGSALSLIHKVSKILENPMDAKLPSEIKKLVVSDDWAILEDSILKLRQNVVNTPSKNAINKMQAYAEIDEKTGKILRFTTEKPTGKAKQIFVNPDRIASEAQLKVIFENTKLSPKDLNSPIIKAELRRKGYIGYKLRDKLELFKEDIVE
jgi:hypothetical protein